MLSTQSYQTQALNTVHRDEYTFWRWASWLTHRDFRISNGGGRDRYLPYNERMLMGYRVLSDLHCEIQDPHIPMRRSSRYVPIDFVNSTCTMRSRKVAGGILKEIASSCTTVSTMMEWYNCCLPAKLSAPCGHMLRTAHDWHSQGLALKHSSASHPTPRERSTRAEISGWFFCRADYGADFFRWLVQSCRTWPGVQPPCHLL